MEIKKNEQQMLMDQQSNAQAAIRNDEDGITTKSDINGFIGKGLIHQVTVRNLLKILEIYFKTCRT